LAARLPQAGDRAPIRVLWLIDSLGTGGAEALTVRFVRALLRRDPSLSRVRPTVAFLKRMRGNPYEAELRALGVEPVFLDARHLRDVAAFRRLLRRIREDDVDVLHAHLAYASIWGALAGWWTGRPVVASLHVTPPRAPRWSREGLRRRLRARLLRRSGVHPVAVSRAVARSWSEATSIPVHRIRVIPNGVEPEPPSSPARRRTARRELGLGDETTRGEAEATVVMTVAVLRRDKGLDLLLEAAGRVLEVRPEVRFVVVGDGPERGALERRAAERGLGDRVLFTGFRSDVSELLTAADLFVLPSREDAFPTVLLEAAAAGLPAVAADVGGVPEIVVSEKTGVLVPPDDPGALAGALIELAARPEERRRIGEAARRRAESELSAGRWLDRLTELYGEVLRGAPTPGTTAFRGSTPRASASRTASSSRLAVTVVEPVGRGGLIHHAFQLCRALAREGVEVTLITSRGYELDEPGDRCPEAPFRIERLLRLWDPKPENPGSKATARRRLRRLGRAVVWYREWGRLIRHLTRRRRDAEGPDMVLFGDLRFAGDLIPLALLAWQCRRGPALVDLCHNIRPFSLGGRSAGRFRGDGFFSRALFRRIYRRFDRVVVHFESNRRRFLDTWGLSPERVGWIPLGNGELFRELADPGVDATLLRRRSGLPPSSPVVLLFGSLARYKGPELLVEAFARVHRHRPDARLVLAGPPLPGLDPDELWRELETRGLADAVRIEAGYVPVSEVAAWMELATVAVFPYREISQSAVVALALTFGVPVVVTRVGAMTEMVRDGETGRVVPPEDAPALARALLELLEDPEQARRLGRAAERFARDELSWSRVARALLAQSRPARDLRTTMERGRSDEDLEERWRR